MKVKEFFEQNWKTMLITGIGVVSTATACMIWHKSTVKLDRERISDLENENLTLRGQIRACERENHHLLREIGNQNYQLGKVVNSKQI